MKSKSKYFQIIPVFEDENGKIVNNKEVKYIERDSKFIVTDGKHKYVGKKVILHVKY